MPPAGYLPRCRSVSFQNLQVAKPEQNILPWEKDQRESAEISVEAAMLGRGVGQETAGTLLLAGTLCQAGGRSRVNPAPAKLDLLSSQIHLLARTVITLLKRRNRSY